MVPLLFPLLELTRHLCSVWVECQGSVGDYGLISVESRVRKGKRCLRMLESTVQVSATVRRLIS